MKETGFASLSPTLLARKGGAKPAMRPQNGAPGKVDGKEAAASLEDLGWNDMGESDDDQKSGEVIQLTAPKSQPEEQTEQALPMASHSPVRDTIERIAEKLVAPQPPPKANNSDAPANRPSGSRKRRAAFTLRLDQDRHLKLRLACTISGRSAQQLVTDAVDSLLSEMPEITTLAAQVKRD